MRTHLNDPLVLAHGLDHALAFHDVVTVRLFDVDVFAGLASPDGAERMPMVRRGDRDDVDVFVVEDAAKVLHDFRFRRTGVGEDLLCRADDVEVNVAQGGDHGIG